MFDPLSYFAHVEKALATCASYAEISWPEFLITFNRFKHWDEIFWRCEVKFPGGHRFTALERHCRDEKGEHLRKIVYRLTEENGDLVFQIDPHHAPIPYGACPHLHIGPSQNFRVEEGDQRLRGYSLREFDFLKVWDLVQNYIKDGSVPWAQ